MNSTCQTIVISSLPTIHTSAGALFFNFPRPGLRLNLALVFLDVLATDYKFAHVTKSHGLRDALQAAKVLLCSFAIFLALVAGFLMKICR